MNPLITQTLQNIPVTEPDSSYWMSLLNSVIDLQNIHGLDFDPVDITVAFLSH